MILLKIKSTTENENVDPTETETDYIPLSGADLPAQSTSSGRATGNNSFGDFECQANKRIPMNNNSLLSKISEVRAELRDANAEVAAMTDAIKDLTTENEAKQKKIRILVSRNVQLQRRVQQLERLGMNI